MMTEYGSERGSVLDFEAEGSMPQVKKYGQSVNGRDSRKENKFIPRVSRKEGTPLTCYFSPVRF